MTDPEILKKAIAKAVKGGWDKDDAYDAGLNSEERFYFSHSFAKAFWKRDDPKCIYCGVEDVPNYQHYSCCPISYSPKVTLWQYHLQQMVISEDSIKYLEQFLD